MHRLEGSRGLSVGGPSKATVDYVPVAGVDSTLVEAQTPDWLIVLRAAEDGTRRPR